MEILDYLSNKKNYRLIYFNSTLSHYDYFELPVTGNIEDELKNIVLNWLSSRHHHHHDHHQHVEPILLPSSVVDNINVSPHHVVIVDTNNNIGSTNMSYSSAGTVVSVDIETLLQYTEQLKDLLIKNSRKLTLKVVDGDGNCVFNCLIKKTVTDNMTRKYRSTVSDKLMENFKIIASSSDINIVLLDGISRIVAIKHLLYDWITNLKSNNISLLGNDNDKITNFYNTKTIDDVDSSIIQEIFHIYCDYHQVNRNSHSYGDIYLISCLLDILDKVVVKFTPKETADNYEFANIEIFYPRQYFQVHYNNNANDIANYLQQIENFRLVRYSGADGHYDFYDVEQDDLNFKSEFKNIAVNWLKTLQQKNDITMAESDIDTSFLMDVIISAAPAISSAPVDSNQQNSIADDTNIYNHHADDNSSTVNNTNTTNDIPLSIIATSNNNNTLAGVNNVVEVLSPLIIELTNMIGNEVNPGYNDVISPLPVQSIITNNVLQILFNGLLFILFISGFIGISNTPLDRIRIEKLYSYTQVFVFILSICTILSTINYFGHDNNNVELNDLQSNNNIVMMPVIDADDEINNNSYWSCDVCGHFVLLTQNSCIYCHDNIENAASSIIELLPPNSNDIRNEETLVAAVVYSPPLYTNKNTPTFVQPTTVSTTTTALDVLATIANDYYNNKYVDNSIIDEDRSTITLSSITAAPSPTTNNTIDDNSTIQDGSINTNSSIISSSHAIIGYRKGKRPPKKKKRKKNDLMYFDEITPELNEKWKIDEKDIISIDPGQNCIISCVDGDSKNAIKFKYTRIQRDFESRRKHYAVIRESLIYSRPSVRNWADSPVAD